MDYLIHNDDDDEMYLFGEYEKILNNSSSINVNNKEKQSQCSDANDFKKGIVQKLKKSILKMQMMHDCIEIYLKKILSNLNHTISSIVKHDNSSWTKSHYNIDASIDYEADMENKVTIKLLSMVEDSEKLFKQVEDNLQMINFHLHKENESSSISKSLKSHKSINSDEKYITLENKIENLCMNLKGEIKNLSANDSEQSQKKSLVVCNTIFLESKEVPQSCEISVKINESYSDKTKKLVRTTASKDLNDITKIGIQRPALRCKLERYFPPISS